MHSYIDGSEGENRIVCLNESALSDALYHYSRKAGFPLVNTFEYQNGEPETAVICSVAGLSEGERLDARHVTEFRASVMRREITDEDKDKFGAHFLPNSEGDEDETLYEVSLPPFDELVQMLHLNSSEVTTPIEDDQARELIVSRLQDHLINLNILLTQTSRGDLYTSDEKTYDNLCPNIKQNAEWTDSILNSEEVASTQIDAATAAVKDVWKSFFAVPYTFYQRALFQSYYADRYDWRKNFKHRHLYWAQAEMYNSVPEIAQCSQCAAVRTEQELDERQACTDKKQCNIR